MSQPTSSVTRRIVVIGIVAFIAVIGNVNIVKEEKRHEVSTGSSPSSFSTHGAAIDQNASKEALNVTSSAVDNAKTQVIKMIQTVPPAVGQNNDDMGEGDVRVPQEKSAGVGGNNQVSKAAQEEKAADGTREKDVPVAKRLEEPRLADVHSRFPRCFLDVKSDNTATNFLAQVDKKYVPTDRPPPYDHESCFVMKARYNCAYPDDSEEPRAHQYKLLFKDKKLPGRAKESWCDLEDFVDCVGGPAGLGRILQRETNKTDKPYQVFIQGNSQLRQVFESLICRYSDQITKLVLSKDGLVMSTSEIALFKKINKIPANGSVVTLQTLARPIVAQPASMGSATGNRSISVTLEELQNLGCHGGDSTQILRYYRANTTAPRSWGGCTDDLASVEFGHSIRFYYIFRPHYMSDETVPFAYRQIGLTQNPFNEAAFESVDVVVVNDKGMKDVRIIKEGVRLKWDSLVDSLYASQQKDLGRKFGADNPFVWNPPDKLHACMPGLTEDEANLLLFGLAGGVTPENRIPNIESLVDR